MSNRSVQKTIKKYLIGCFLHCFEIQSDLESACIKVGDESNPFHFQRAKNRNAKFVTFNVKNYSLVFDTLQNNYAKQN